MIFSLPGTVSAQNARETSTASSASIATWISQLGSKSFVERLTATKKLKEAGATAVRPLQAALKTADREQEARIRSILSTLETESLTGILAELDRDPNSSAVTKLPEWTRYAEIVGQSAADRQFYVRLVKAETDLFQQAAQDIRAIRTPLRRRAAEVLQLTREATRQTKTISLDGCAALLLLAGHPDLLLRGDTSTSLNSLLVGQAFETHVQSPDGDRLMKLAGAYIQRSNIAVVDPLRFARRFPSEDGLKLARRVLTSTLRGVDGQMALIVIREQGDESDLPLVESLLNHPGILAQGRRTQLNATKSYTATNGDLALAVACSLRKQDPRDYGFSRIDNVGEEFRFALDTIGFSSEADRAKSRKLYRDRWLVSRD